MFNAKQWREFLDIFNREGPFQWDIPGGYIIFGSAGMTVYKLYKRQWRSKHVNCWQNRCCTEVNRELRNQRWKDEG